MEENVAPTAEASAPPPPPPPSAPPPPPASPPPVIIPPLPQPAPRRGRGWMALALVLLVLLALSGFYNLSNFFGNAMGGRSGMRYASTRTVGPRLEEVVTEDNDSVNKVVVVEIRGIITGQPISQEGFGMVEVIKAALRRAEDDVKVRAVLLKVDSPGGEVLASDEIYRAIAEFQKRSAKPVVASMGNLAASGGYYVSAPCQWIVANELTITGSIGVIMHGWNYRGLMNKVGVRPEVYKSGKFKDMLSGDRELDQITAEERQMVQGLIDRTYNRFTNVVAAGREQAQKKNKGTGRKLELGWGEYADGRVLSGSEAYDRGFVDQLGNFEAAIERAKQIAGISSANLIEYQQRYDLSDLLRMFSKTEGRALKVDLGLDAPKLQAGQLYFLSPTFLH